MGLGRGRGPQAGTSRVQGRVYPITPPAESADQPVVQGTFLLSHLWARVLFDSGAYHSFIVASVVIELSLEVDTLEEPLYVSSPLGIRARIGMICRGCELEILGILLVTPPIPVRPDWRIRTGFRVRNHMLGLLIFIIFFF